MTQFVSKNAWDAQVSQGGVTDKIIVRNLDITVNAGVDVWGRRKKQRAFVSVTLSLARKFDSASAIDNLDDSTVHYGTLSKAVQKQLQESDGEWMCTADLVQSISSCVRKVSGETKIFALEVDLFYQKGSMLGDGVGLTSSIIEETDTRSNVLYLRNVRIPCLIGLNSNERLAKQPVVVNLWIENLPKSRNDDYVELEATVVQTVSESSYQTIESLVAKVVQELRDKFFTKEGDEAAYIRLRIEKPMAVPFADAPAVEILRPVKVSQ